MCSSSGESIVSIRPLVCVTLKTDEWSKITKRLTFCILYHSAVFRVTHTRGGIDTIDSPDDEHLVARNMYRTGINKYKKKNCAPSWLFTKCAIP